MFLRSLLALISLAAAASALGNPTITRLAYVTVGGMLIVDDAQVSDDGSVVASSMQALTVTTGLTWRRGLNWGLWPTPAGAGIPSGVNRDGSAISFNNGVWTETDGFVTYAGFANAISANGSVAVGSVLGGTTGPLLQRARWIAHQLELPPPGFSWFEAVNEDGSTSFGTLLEGTPTDRKLVRWSQGVLTVLDTVPEATSGIRPRDCNRAGTIVIGERGPDAAPFRWDGLVGTSLAVAPSSFDDLSARSLTEDASLVIGFARIPGTNTRVAVVWVDTTTLMLLADFLVAEGLDLTGWSLERATDISPDGRFITGGGRYNGQLSGFLIERDLGVGISFCVGDGGDQMGCTNCPCSNNAPAGTIGGCLNSANTSARLEATGDLSVSLSSLEITDLRFALSGAPANAFCILNSGDGVAPVNMTNPCFGMNSGTQAATFDGLHCAVMNTRRHGGRSADSNGDVGATNNPWGGEGGPPVGIAVAGGGFVAGQTRYFQVIHRDDPLAVCGRGLNTSQAVEILFTP